MSNALTTRNAIDHALTVPADLEAVRGYVDESLSANTRRAYRSSLAAFRAWCEAEGVDALPACPETVAAFLAAEADAGRSSATLGQRKAAIRWAHEAAATSAPRRAKLVGAALKGIRRKLEPRRPSKAPRPWTLWPRWFPTRTPGNAQREAGSGAAAVSASPRRCAAPNSSARARGRGEDRARADRHAAPLQDGSGRQGTSGQSRADATPKPARSRARGLDSKRRDQRGAALSQRHPPRPKVARA